jgi:ADP-heptose:LPS heptosyltransferase
MGSAGGLERILVIKLSALGDLVLALPFLKAIREAHPAAHITLLTTRPFVDFMTRTGYFDAIWVDPRAPWWRLWSSLGLLHRLGQGRFDRIYDLQGNQRTRSYFRGLARPKPEWSGNAPGASHPHPDIAAPRHLTLHRRLQLEVAGIHTIDPPDLSFLTADLRRFDLPSDFVLLVPGGSPHRLDKRWPALHYADLAKRLMQNGLVPVLVGSAAEASSLNCIAAACPEVRNLGGATSLSEIAALGRASRFAVGNDTGPMHLIAGVGTAALVLYSAASDPRRIRPWGTQVAVLQREPLVTLGVEEVWQALSVLRQPGRPATARPDRATGDSDAG